MISKICVWKTIPAIQKLKFAFKKLYYNKNQIFHYTHSITLIEACNELAVPG